MHYSCNISPVLDFLYQANQNSTQFYFESTFIRLMFLADLNPLSWVQGGENNTEFHNEKIPASHILFFDR